MATKKPKQSPDDELLEVARKRFQLAEEAESESNEKALDDLRFVAGEQWDPRIQNDRYLDGRPCLTINKLVQSVHQVTNDQRQNRPAIKVSPVDNEATVETAEVFQGLIRHVENYSHADVAYDRAFDAAVRTGRGYFRIITDYCDESSFDLEIFFKSIRNRFSVKVDPHYQEPDGSDMDWAFIEVDMSKDQFMAQYPESKLSKMDDWTALGNQMPGWMKKDSARIAEYFYKTFQKAILIQLSDGSVLEKDQLPATLPEGISIQAEREVIKPAIKWLKINGIEVLERTDWPGRWIPIVPVIGDELDIDGKVINEGLVRHAKDSQRMYNYFASSEAEAIALAPKAPWIGAEGQFKGHEQQWKEANRKNVAFLQYVPKSLNGTPVGPPQRVQADANIQAITEARGLAGEDLKATTGIYDATLGNRSNEQSGLAIQRRNSQAQTSNFHFIDNLARSIRHGGRIVMDLLPHVYDTPRVGRILHEDGQAEMVPLNQPFQAEGKDVIHDLSKGKYDVVVTTGPNFQTRRMEAQQGMIEFTKALPQTAPLISDLVARNSDWPGADQIADRLKKTLPPGVADDPKDNQQPLPPHVQQQMQQMNAMIGQLSQHLHAAQDEIEQKTKELASKERIALTQVQAQIEIALAKMQSESAQTLLGHQVGEIETKLNMLPSLDSGNEQPSGQAPAAAETQTPTGGQSPGPSMGV